MNDLAINGGKPVRSSPMPFRHAFGELEQQALKEAVAYYVERGEDPPYQGRFENLFCQEFSEFLGGGYTDAVSSGTASVYIALAALELPRESEVIISPVTDSGPLNSIILLGHTPVVADSRFGSYNMGVKEFLDRITPRTSGLLAVHSAGEPLPIDEIVREAHSRNIKVLEDCSQAPGATCAGKPVGTFGDIAAFSTMYRKTLFAGASGGLVYTKDLDLHRKALAYADRGKMVWRTDLDLRNPEHSLFPALNFNTDELSCAIGRASLKRLRDSINARLSFLESLAEGLPQRSKVVYPYPLHRGFSPFYFPLFVRSELITVSKEQFAKALIAEGVSLLPTYGCLVSAWPWARPYMSDNFDTPNARHTRDNSFNLFLNEQYGEQEVEDTLRAIEKVENAFLRSI